MKNSIMKAELKLFEDCPIIHQTIEEVENKFGIKVTGYCNPHPSIENRKEPGSDFKLYPKIYIFVEGTFEKMHNFTQKIYG